MVSEVGPSGAVGGGQNNSRRPALAPATRAQGWELWLSTLAAAPPAAVAKIRPPALAVATGRFAEGDRDPRLILILARVALAARRWDAAARDVLLLLGANGDPALAAESAAARLGVVRADASLRTFSPSRLSWYREALAAGSMSAASLLAVAALRAGQTDPPDADAALALHRCLERLSPSQWQAIGASAEAARAWLVDYYLRPEVGADSPAALDLLHDVVRAEPHRIDLLTHLAALVRPALDARAVEIYEALWVHNADDTETLVLLATAHLDHGAALADPGPVLTAYAAHEPAATSRVAAALADAAVRAERTDDEALGWLEAALASPDSRPEHRAWLAVATARRELAGEANEALWREVTFDPEAPTAQRGEVGLVLLNVLRARGELDDELAETVWRLLPPDQRPDGLVLGLAERLAAQGRADAAVAPLYRRAYALNPTPELDRLLATAYLHDDETPVRVKIEHWKAALERRHAEPAVVAALARAYVPLGSLTEAAVDIAERVPPAQRYRLLDDLCRQRYHRDDYHAAEALAAALVRAAPADDPGALAAAQSKLLACVVRRRLADGRGLAQIDLGPARAALDALDPADPIAQRLADQLALIAAAAGAGDPARTATALDRLGPADSVAGRAAAQLAGRAPEAEPEIDTSDPGEVWALAQAAHLAGHQDAAEALVGRLARPLAEAGRALWSRLPGETQSEALARRLAAIHRLGPPWDALAAASLDEVTRRGSRGQVERVAEQLSPAQHLAAELRLLAGRETDNAARAVERATALNPAANPELAWAMGDSLAARWAQGLLAAGSVVEAEVAIDVLRERLAVATRPQPTTATRDVAAWLTAQLAHARGNLPACWDALAELSPAGRVRPIVAFTTAAWQLAESQPRRAEAELAQALAAQPDDPELLYATLALSAAQGRGETFGRLVEPALAGLADDDPRRDGLELVHKLLAGDLTTIEATDLFTNVADRSDEHLLARLQAALAVGAARLQRAHDPAGAGAFLRACVVLLRAERRPALARSLMEVHNLRAYCAYLQGDQAEAQRLLARMTSQRLSVGHNLARVAAEAGDVDQALNLWQRLTPEWEGLELEAVSPAYRSAALLAWRLNLAELLASANRWADALEHLETCLRERPLDIDLQRKIIPALIAVGQGEVALYKSEWLLKERPNDLEILLEHGMVLASVNGTRAGLDWYDELLVRRPDTAEAIRQRRRDLRDRLTARSAELAREGDHMGLFTLGRDLEHVAESDEARARALAQQAYALHSLAEADPDQRRAMLERGLDRVAAALTLEPKNERLVEQLHGLQNAMGPKLAPELIRDGLELLVHRRRDWGLLAESGRPRTAADRERVTNLQAAFERIVEHLSRAAELRGRALEGQAAEALAEARKLAAQCAQLAAPGGAT